MGMVKSVEHILYTDNSFCQLNGAIDSSVTTINTTTISSGFPSSGNVFIDNEKIHYGARTTNQLQSCTRGYQGTTAASHTDQSIVTFYASPIGSWAGSANGYARIGEALSKNQDLTHCLVLGSMGLVDVGTFQQYGVQYYIDPTNFPKQAAGYETASTGISPMHAVASVIEFDPAHANVYSKQLTFDGTTMQITDTLPKSVSLARSFLCFSVAHCTIDTPAGTDIMGAFVPNGDSSNTVSFTAIGSNPPNQVSIFYFVVESLQAEVSVQHLSATLNSGSNSITIPLNQAVDSSKSAIFASWNCNETNQWVSGMDSFIFAWNGSPATSITMTRPRSSSLNGSWTVNINLEVVTFLDGTTVSSGTTTITNFYPNEDNYVDASGVLQDQTALWSPVGSWKSYCDNSPASGSSGAEGYQRNCFMRLTFAGNQLDISNYGSATPTTKITYQMIQLALAPQGQEVISCLMPGYAFSRG